MKKVKFITATIVDTNIAGYSVEFEIEYIKENSGFYKDEKLEYFFRVTFTQFVLLRWQLADGLTKDKLIKLAFPFAVEGIIERIKDGTLKDFEEQLVRIENDMISYPFDITKIEKVEGYEIEFPNEEQTISIKIEQNVLANDIIVLRDNINALFYAKTNNILLKLGQERNILSLFRQVDTEEQLKYSVATLANLASDINGKTLRKLTDIKDTEIKSISLLEFFLNTIDKDNQEIIKILRSINRMRQGFPIHTDKAGIVETLKSLNIEYPVLEYDKTWRILLNKYKIALSLIMEKIKKYAA